MLVISLKKKTVLVISEVIRHICSKPQNFGYWVCSHKSYQSFAKWLGIHLVCSHLTCPTYRARTSTGKRSSTTSTAPCATITNKCAINSSSNAKPSCHEDLAQGRHHAGCKPHQQFLDWINGASTDASAQAFRSAGLSLENLGRSKRAGVFGSKRSPLTCNS